jgi:Mg-chelatase subunit ChlD
MKKVLALVLCFVLALSGMATALANGAEGSPAPSGQPANTQTPAASEKPDASANPVQSAGPAASPEADPSAQPDVSPSPSATVDPDVSPNPSASVDPSVSPNPSATPVPGGLIVDGGEIDPQRLFAELMAAQTIEDAQMLIEALTPQQQEAFFAALSEQQRAELDAYLNQLSEAGMVYEPAANYDVVANFRDVMGQFVSKPARARARTLGNPAAVNAPVIDPDNALEMTKTATANPDGTYTISLEAYTTGSVTISSEARPCDIILVLDRSTSMKEDFSGSSTTYIPVYEEELEEKNNYYIKDGRRYRVVTWCETCEEWTSGCFGQMWHIAGTAYTPKTSASDDGNNHVQFYARETVESMNRLAALKKAASSFVDEVASQGTGNRIAVVSFGQNAYQHTGSSAATAFLNVSTGEQAIKNAISGISADENATEHGKGLVMAEEIFNANASSTNTRVVVMITDGEPAPKDTDDWSARVVKQAVNSAYALKIPILLRYIAFRLCRVPMRATQQPIWISI